jgi:uncharacterized protein YodC (DUF2158 family)
MADRDFKVGDVVFLNSGSPQLTITALNDAKTHAEVSYWNVATSKFEDATFKTETISVVEYSTPV